MFVATGIISNNTNNEIPINVISSAQNTFANRFLVLASSRNFNVAILSLKFAKNQKFIFETEHETCFIICELSNKQEIAQISKQKINEVNSDAELLFCAYQKIGKKIFNHSIGKWIFIAKKNNSETIEIWRDHLGMYSLYYFINNKNLYFSTHLGTLFQYSNIPKQINNLHVAGLVMGYSGKVNETAFAGVYKVPSASSVTISNANIKIHRYWQISKKNIKYSNKNEYYEHFYHILNQVLNENVDNNDVIASTLSSGLDSTFLTSYLSEYLQNKNNNLYAITSVPLKEFKEFCSGRRYGNEEPLSKLVVQNNSNVVHLTDDAANFKIIDSLQKSLLIHGYPIRNALNQHWILSMFNKLQEFKVNKLFIAQMGNLTISWPFIEHSNSLISKMYRIASNYIPLSSKELVNSHKEYFNKHFLESNHFHIYLWKNGYMPYFDSFSSFRKKMYHFEQILLQGFCSWIEKGIYYGINVVDPFADPRIIEYCFALPNKMFKTSHETRFFVKSLAQNFVPEEIINNNKKAIQSADIDIRLKNEFDDIYKIIDLSHNFSDLNNILNLREIIKQMSEKKIKNQVLLRLLLIILFFQFATSNNFFRKKIKL